MPVLVPEFVSAALARGEKRETIVGACLVLDLAALFAILDDYGEYGEGEYGEGEQQAGLAERSALVNAELAALIAEIREKGGFPAQLDAAFCVAIFPDDGASVEAATGAARSLYRRRVRVPGKAGTPSETAVVHRAGVGRGPVSWEHVGPSYDMAPVLHGEPLRDARALCRGAEPGTIALEGSALSLDSKDDAEVNRAAHEVNAAADGVNPAADAVNTAADGAAGDSPTAGGSPTADPAAAAAVQRKQAAVCLIRVDSLDDLKKLGAEILSLSTEMDGTFNGFDVSRDPGVARVIFGIPKAIDGPAKRAVDFAVALRDRLPSEVRAAVAAGPVYTALHGSGPRQTLLVLGAAVDRADALLARDSMGEIIIAPEIRAPVEGVYALQPRGRARLPAYRKTVEVAEVLWREQGTPRDSELFVGRDEEYALLRSYLEADAEEPATAALITGPPGIGKSSLVRAVLGDLSAASVLSVRGSDQHLPGFSCLLEALQQYWNLPLRDDPRFATVVAERFDATELRTGDNELQAALQRLRPFVEYSLGLRRPIVVSLDPETRHNGIREGWVALLRALQAVRVLWVDDLQWLDESSRDTLEAWISGYAPARTRVVLCVRSNGEAAPSGPVFGRPPRELDLSALAPEASAALLAERGVDRLLGPAGMHVLVQRSSGNPFFLEQSARYVEEESAAGGQAPADGDEADMVPTVPEQLESLILARVARLSERVREAVQRAAILGFRFDMRVLSAMLRQESLLESMEPDEREELWSATAELSSIFSHALVRDVVYQSQLATEQRALHAAAAAAYEEVYSGSARRARLYEIAEHYERAGVRDRALVCLAEAAEYALEEYENERAIDLLRRRVALADSADFGARHELGRALIRVGAWDEAAEVLEAVVSGLDAVPAGADPGDVVDCLVALADLYIDQGATDNAGSLIQRGISLAEQHDYYAGLAYLYRNRGLIAYRRQDLDAALHAYETGLSHARREGGERVIARVYNDMAIVLTKMGRHEEALEAFRANLDLARRLNEFAGISAALNNIGFLYNEMHRPDDAVAYFREDLELCHAAGNRQGRSVALGNIGDIMFVLESHEEAIERFREAIAIDRQIGFLPHESYMHQQLGRVLVDLDRVEEGCGELHEALRIAEEIDFPMVRDKTQELGSACHG